MNSLNKVSALSVLLAGLPTTLCAEVLFYSGDIGPDSTFASNLLVISGGSQIFEKFALTSPTLITHLFVNQIGSSTSNTSSFEIRSGVQPGIGGQLIASGIGPSTSVATGRFSPGGQA